MGTQIFLGRPSPAIETWIKAHYAPETEIKTKMMYGSTAVESSIVGALKASDLGIVYYNWENLVELLEDYPNQTAALPAVGSYLKTSYDIGEDEFVPFEWQVLGYNASIPEYIKYKNGDERVYVRSVKSGLLAAVAVGDTVYIRDEANMYTDSGKTVGAKGDAKILNTDLNCTYGNNCGWTVPESITVDGTTYAFAGYNITLASKLALGVKYDGKFYTYCQFDSNRGENNWGQNDWSTSMLRTWMNGEGDTSRLNKQIWYNYSDSSVFTYGKGIKPLRVRFNDNSFADHVQNTVNRTWTYSSGSYDLRAGKVIDSATGCEHVIDKFWTLGMGSINCTGKNSSGKLYFPDANYDTSKFSEIWPTSKSILKSYAELKHNYMASDGTDSGTPCRWWLRSALTSYSYYVGSVLNFGYVSYYYANNYVGVLPACTIC